MLNKCHKILYRCLFHRFYCILLNRKVTKENRNLKYCKLKENSHTALLLIPGPADRPAGEREHLSRLFHSILGSIRFKAAPA